MAAKRRKATKRKATKRKTTRRKGIKRRTPFGGGGTKRKTTKRKATKRRMVDLWSDDDFHRDARSGLYVPVPASKMRKGIKKAQDEIRGMIREIAALMTDDFAITEIELTAGFNADGKFMGFGIGGDASIKIKIAPSS